MLFPLRYGRGGIYIRFCTCFVSVQDKRILVYVCPLDSSTLSKVMASKMLQFLLIVLRLVNNILVSMKFWKLYVWNL